MTGVQRQELKNLQSNSQNSIVIGVIIGSLNTRNFEARNQRFGTGGMRAVWTFTLRDSIEDFINVTVWGGVEFINRVYKSYRIGQVVEVINAKVKERKLDSVNEMYVPSATSPFTLIVNEGVALIQAHDSPAIPRYLSLLRVITKPLTEARSLNIILSNIDEFKDEFINISPLPSLSFLRYKIGQGQKITTRDGRNSTFRIFEVCDGSTEEAVQLKLWDEEWIRMSEVWEPNRTALFIADARVAYNNYKRKCGITIVNKSVITEDPDIPEIPALKNAVQNKPGLVSSDPFALPNPKVITNVMTIQEITEKLNENCSSLNSDRLKLLTVIRASITEINLDTDITSIIFTKCALCKQFIQKDNDSCMNLECPSGNGSRVPMNTITLSLKVHLKDDTGYLVGCRLNGSAAENAVGKNAGEIQIMSEEERTNLKWNLLLMNFEARLQILGPTAEYPRAIYNILSLTLDENEDDLVNFMTN